MLDAFLSSDMNAKSVYKRYIPFSFIYSILEKNTKEY